jgi:hypothetical protein
MLPPVAGTMPVQISIILPNHCSKLPEAYTSFFAVSTNRNSEPALTFRGGERKDRRVVRKLEARNCLIFHWSHP